MAGDDHRARQRGDNREARRHQRRHMHRRFGNADNRAARQFPRRQQSRVAKAGDHMPLRALRFALLYLLQHADGGNRFIEMPFYGFHALRRAAGEDSCARRGDAARSAGYGFGHLRAGIGVNDLYTKCTHCGSPRVPNRRVKSGSVSPLRSKRRLETMWSKWCAMACSRPARSLLRKSSINAS